MEERYRVLIGLGAAVAANCVPCFNHYYQKVQKVRLTEEEILEAVEIGNRMKTGAMMAVRNSINDIMNENASDRASCCSDFQTSGCC